MSPAPTRPEAAAPARRRRWLVISHAFNMDGRAASLTVTDKLPFLQARGIDPVIISGALGSRDTVFEHHQRLPWGPSGLRFDLRHVIALRHGRGAMYRLITITASVLLAPFMLIERLLLGLRHQWSWSLPAWLTARRLLARSGIELVYTSAGAYSAQLAGLWLKLGTGVPWIAEIHDPIVIPGRLPATRDARFQARLEGWICRHADLVWWFTEGALAAATQRHPGLGDRGMWVLPGANPPVHRVAYQRSKHCVFGHFGSLSSSRSLAPALRGLAALLQRRPELSELLRIEVYGGGLDVEAEQAVAALGLAPQVQVIGRLEHDPVTGLSGRERVMQRMQGMDVLLMMHGQVPECPEYIPSKLYDYFWAQRPVLACTWRNPQLDALVHEHGGMAVPTDDPVAITTALETAYERWLRNDLADTQSPPLSVQAAVDTIMARADAVLARQAESRTSSAPATRIPPGPPA